MPIEHALIKKGLNIDKNLTIGQKRENCKQFAREQIEIQKKGFARLGLATDFKDCYYTLTNDFEADELWFFLAAIKQELVYQDLKPVFWSWSSQTALADAEVEYSDEDSYSIYVTFDVVEGNHALQANDKLLI
jgi:isoleucyl-tRNA synthetase